MAHLLTWHILTDTATERPADKKVCIEQWQTMLKRSVAHLLLFAYALMLGKPAMPLVMDAMAHTFWESQHLMTVHEEHGKFHVHYETVNTGDKCSKDKPGNSNKAATEDNLCVVTELVFNYSAAAPSAITYTSYTCSYSSSYLLLHYPPPRV